MLFYTLLEKLALPAVPCMTGAWHIFNIQEAEAGGFGFKDTLSYRDHILKKPRPSD